MKLTLKNSNLLYFLTVVVHAIYLVFRSPEIFFGGRYFAEEGAIWWSYSLQNSFFDTLLYTPVSAGYICFICNLQIATTKLVPVLIGPFLTTWLSLVIYFLPSYLFFTLSKEKTTNLNRLTLGILLLILPSINFLEVFGHSINNPTYLGLSVFIILIYGLEKNQNLILQYVIIFIGFLSQYYSLIMFPLFLLKYFVNNNKHFMNAFIIGIVSSAIQINILFYKFNFVQTGSLFNRGLDTGIESSKLYNIIVDSVTFNFFGEYKLGMVSMFSHTISILDRYQNKDLIVSIMSTFLIFLIVSRVLYKKNYKEVNIFLTITAIFLQIILLNFGMIGEFYGRYAVVLPTLIVFLLLQLYPSNKKIFLYLLFISIANFNTQGGKYFIECDPYCIDWSDQINNIELGVDNKYVHWPLGEGDPYWYTDAYDPKPNPAPFQVSDLGELAYDYYNINLKQVVAKNFNLLRK